MSLPVAWYCEGEPFQHEKRTLFATAWQLLASTAALKQPGDFVTANLGGWPVFALVDADGRVGAFRNVCRHQGMQVLEKARGRCENLRCRYHGWTYDFAGRMVSAPELVAPAEPQSADNHLRRINSATLGPLLFVNLDENSQSLGAELGELLPKLVRTVTGRDFGGEISTDYNCNWKTYIEHCLTTRAFGDDGAWLWQWPLVMIHSAASAVHVEQIVPRTFARSRVIAHVFVPEGTDASGALDAAKKRGLADKLACEALQRQREAGDSGDDSRFVDFHRAMREVHERPPHDDPLPLQQGVA